jgi:hypothetical protein
MWGHGTLPQPSRFFGKLSVSRESNSYMARGAQCLTDVDAQGVHQWGFCDSEGMRKLFLDLRDMSQWRLLPQLPASGCSGTT